MKTSIIFLAAAAAGTACFFSMAQQPAVSADGGAGTAIVSRDIGDPEANQWKEGEWVTTGGELQALNERPDDPDAPKNAKSLRLITKYGVRSFGGWQADYVARTLPGKPVKFTCWARKGTDKSYGMSMELVDAKDRKFNLGIYPPSTEWKKFELMIPEKAGNEPIEFPIKLNNINQNNWGDKNNPEAVTRILDIYDLRLYTDMSEVKPEDRAYFASISIPIVGGTFYYGEDKPVMTLSAGSWLGEKRILKTKAEVVSADGRKKALEIGDMECLDGASRVIDLPFTQPGAYTVNVTIQGFPKEITASKRYIVCLKPQKLTKEQNRYSPYAINIHGGGYVGYEKFSRIGFEWVRDYAFDWGWMNRARGEGTYAGWPWYPKIISAAERENLTILPCLMGAIQYRNKDAASPKVPTAEWRRQMALIVATFPNMMAWELDNERDATTDCYGPEYGAYHKAFADIMNDVVPDCWAVSEGSAGIHVEAARKHVLSGDYKNIDVINGHRYCGIDAPEYSKSNANTGMGEARQTFLRDVWRNWKAAACADGKDRQLWVTEFGWDTRAGKIVTEWEQAAYCQRGYMLGLASGIDKIFWYWYYDSNTPTPSAFFDGCGIFDRFRDPKPVAAAFAAMRHFLPADMKYVGFANLSPNAMVQIFEIEGKYVAAAFKIRINGPAFTIEQPKAEKVYDMFGAEINGTGKRNLDIAPTWYIGLDKNCGWLKQTPMDIESNFFVRNVAGEAIEIHVTKTGDYSVEVPKGWTSEKTEFGFSVTAPEGTPRGPAEITVIGKNEGVEKVMVVDVDVVPEAYAKSYAVDFDGGFKVECVNQSTVKKTHTVIADMPAGWEVSPPQQEYTLDPEEKTSLDFKLVKSTPIPASELVETPKILVKNEKGMIIDSVPVVPREWAMKKAGEIVVDGKLNEWNSLYQIPAWMLGPRGDKETTKAYMAYADEGIYLAFNVTDSKCFTADPRAFWTAADCLEFMFNPEGTFKKGEKWTLNHHQFWFCPMPADGNAYAGIWGRCDGQKIEHPLADIKTSVVKNDDGYVMEILIPASRIHGYKPQKGVRAGISFTLAVQGHRDQREVFWPASKRDDMIGSPWMWGRVTLD